MRTVFTICIFILFSYSSYCQTSIQTKEVKIQYSNGYEIFRVCKTGCSVNYDDKKEYSWYTEFSNIKTTKGGSGGNLLHGNYKFYDELGNLRQDKNYHLGLPDGSEKNWDSLGNITSQAKYNKGTMVYWKFQNDEKYWIEWIGPLFENGTVKKVYSQFNTLLSEQTMLTRFKQKTKTYYEYSGKLKEEYTTTGFGGEYMSGKYTKYFENGKIQTEGQFYDGEFLNIRDGIWRWYKSDGTLEVTTQYKANVEKWASGEYKVVGGLVFDSNSNEWLKTGEWNWYSEDGSLQSSKVFNFGVETLK